MGRTLRQRLVDAVRKSLGGLLSPDSFPPLLWRLVCGGRSNVSEWVAGVDGHGQWMGGVGGSTLENVWRNRDRVLAKRRPSVSGGGGRV